MRVMGAESFATYNFLGFVIKAVTKLKIKLSINRKSVFSTQ